jgi:hypothetical protein
MATSGFAVPFGTTSTSGTGGAFAGINNGTSMLGPSANGTAVPAWGGLGGGTGIPTNGTASAAPGSSSLFGTVFSGPTNVPQSNGSLNQSNGFTGSTTGGSQGVNYTGSNVFGMDPGSSTYQWLSSKDSSLTKTYGKDAGAALGQFIQSGAGFSQAQLDQLFASMKPEEAQQLAALSNSSGTSGTRFSSANDFAVSNYEAQVNSTQEQIEYNAYNQSVQNMMAILMGSKSVPSGSNAADITSSAISTSLMAALSNSTSGQG